MVRHRPLHLCRETTTPTATAPEKGKGSPRALGATRRSLSSLAAFFAGAQRAGDSGFLLDVLRRNADDFDAGSPGDVHRPDDVGVLHVLISLHEDDLLGPVPVH